MTQFVIILEDGTLYKNVYVKIGKFFATTNADIYWYLKEFNQIEIFSNDSDSTYSNIEFSTLTQSKLIKNISPKKILKHEIYYFTTSKNYKH